MALLKNGMLRPQDGVIAWWKLVTRIRKAKKIVDGIPENVKMGEEKEENWRSIALSGKIKISYKGI